MKGVRSMKLDVDRRLIALVRKFPALYDGEDARYQDAAWKTHAWRKISEELGMDAKLCRSRWFNMRDIYRKSLIRNQMKQRLGQSVRVYKYARDLAFLRHFFSSLAPPDPLADADRQGSDNESMSFPDMSPGPAEASSDVAKRERTASPEPHASPEGPAPGRAPHPVDAFLACIGPTLKALPPYFLSLAKGEIFAAVQKYELRMLGPTEGAHVSTSDAPPPDTK